MNKLEDLIRPDLQQFSPYSSARDEAKKGKIWLNANELPWAIEEMQAMQINRYPQKQPADLIEQLAPIYSVEAKQMALLRGSDEVIDLLIRLFCRAEKDALMICPPTFGMYAVYGQLQGAKVIEIPLLKEEGFQLNVNTIMQQWNPSVKLIFLCSPNNPTGNLINSADIFALCQQLRGKSMIVVDEAYVEFASQPSLANAIREYDNLIILRTFSKAYGLAGARCGLLLAQPAIVKWIYAIMPPYPLSAFTIQAVLQAISPDQLKQLRQQIDCIKTQRSYLAKQLEQMPIIKKVWPSDANFLLVEFNDDAKKIMNLCGEQGIVLRDMSNRLLLQNCIRISIGSPEENAQLINVLQGVKL